MVWTRFFHEVIFAILPENEIWNQGHHATSSSFIEITFFTFPGLMLQ